MRKKKSKTAITRSYFLKVAPEMNPGKRRAVEELREEWRRTAKAAMRWLWAPFWKTGQFDYRMATSGASSGFPKTRLVTSQKDLMAAALAGQAKSWAGNVVRRARRSIANASVGEALRHEMFWINAMRLWNASNATQNQLLAALAQNAAAAGKQPTQLQSVSQAATRTMRKWFGKHVERVKLPDPEGIPPMFNVNSGLLVKAQSSKHQYFHWWARLCTLKRGARIELPLQSCDYFDTRKGEMIQTLELHERGGELYLKVAFSREPKKWTAFQTDVLALDLGMRNFLASSEGDLRGVDYLDDLRKLDRQIQAVQKGLQQAGVAEYGQCKRYRKLISRLRGFIKTNVRTWLRSILEARRPRKVVIERLAFTGEDVDLGRVLNRLIRGFGQAVFKEALAQLSQEFGFEVEEVDPAHTSQKCSHCGFVHERNRNGNKFACLSCGFKAHADVNAAKCQRGRSASAEQGPESAAPASRHGWWLRSLGEWLSRLREGFLAAPPGSTWEARLVGRACAGASWLRKREKGPKALSKRMLLWLERELQQPDPRRLRETIVRRAPRVRRAAGF